MATNTGTLSRDPLIRIGKFTIGTAYLGVGDASADESSRYHGKTPGRDAGQKHQAEIQADLFFILLASGHNLDLIRTVSISWYFDF